MIDESLDRAPIVDKAGYPYLIHPLTDGVPRVDPRLLRAWVDWALQQPETDEAHVILAPEAMALPLAAALSLESATPFVCARKREYGLPDEHIAYCETGYGRSCLYINDIRAGERVLIVDDVLSTGGTLDGLLSTLRAMGAVCLGALVFLDKGDAAPRLAETHGVPVRAMRTVRVEGDKVLRRPADT